MFTRNDAREEKILATLNREHASAVRQAKAKVRHWERKVEQFGGEIHRETLARMRANLEELK